MPTARPAKPAKNPNRWDPSNWNPGKVTLFNALGLGSWNIQWPKFSASLANQASQAQNATQSQKNTGNKGTGNISTQGASPASIKGIFNALRSAGASQNQAIGMIANAINESSLNVESKAMDSNGAMSYGLWQFNAASYPDADTLVTGNPGQDLVRQIQYLFAHGGLSAANGSTPQAAAGSFAQHFEVCQGCQPGGDQYNQRVGNVAQILKALGLLWLPYRVQQAGAVPSRAVLPVTQCRGLSSR